MPSSVRCWNRPGRILQFTSERLEKSQKKSVNLQERNTQLQEKEDKQEEEIKELKRQINIRDDIIQKENEDIRFTEASRNNTRKTDLTESIIIFPSNRRE